MEPYNPKTAQHHAISMRFGWQNQFKIHIQMTATELLQPRFEIIADFPNNYLGKVGTILDRDWGAYPDGEDNPPAWTISMFPHLFRKLNWWEGRTAIQMPRKVISMADDNRDVYEIEEWDMKQMIGWIDKKERVCVDLCLFEPQYGYMPVD